MRLQRFAFDRGWITFESELRPTRRSDDREGVVKVGPDIRPHVDPMDNIIAAEDADEALGLRHWRITAMDDRLYEAILRHLDPYDLEWRLPLRSRLFAQVAATLEELAPDLADSMTTHNLRDKINEVRKFLHSKQLWVRPWRRV